jgi:hypothetical protein
MMKHYPCDKPQNKKNYILGMPCLNFNSCGARMSWIHYFQWIHSCNLVLEKNNPMLALLVSLARCSLLLSSKHDWQNIYTTLGGGGARLRRVVEWGLALWQPSSHVSKWLHEVSFHKTSLKSTWMCLVSTLLKWF